MLYLLAREKFLPNLHILGTCPGEKYLDFKNLSSAIIKHVISTYFRTHVTDPILRKLTFTLKQNVCKFTNYTYVLLYTKLHIFVLDMLVSILFYRFI